MSGLVITGLFLSLSANAALISALGGQAVYDTDLDITWLADANAGAGSPFDDGASITDGRMSWQSANDWAASLTVGGFTDWRLPFTSQPDPTCNGQTQGDGFGINCTGSEMGHLFYSELSGTAGQPITSSGDPDLALFSNIIVDGNHSWSSELIRPSAPGNAWYFQFSNGDQNAFLQLTEKHAWAVHGGNLGVAVVPIPASVWMFGSALGLLGWMRRKSA